MNIPRFVVRKKGDGFYLFFLGRGELRLPVFLGPIFAHGIYFVRFVLSVLYRPFLSTGFYGRYSTTGEQTFD